MQPRRLVALTGLLLALSVVSVRAQVLEPPPRPYRGLFGGGPPPDPTRSRQELNLTGSLLGGYEDSLVPPYGGSPVIAYPAGSTVFWDAGLHYRIGEQVRSFEAKGRGYMNGYSLDGVGPYYGGEQSIRARTKFGRRIELEVTEDFRFDPYVTLGLFNTIQGFDIAGTPDAHSTTAVTTSRSKIFNGSGVVSYNWNRRTKTDFGVSYTKQDVDGFALDHDAISPWVAYEHAMNRTLSVVAAYRGSHSQFTTVSGFKTPMQDHRVDGGLKYQRKLSRTRSLTWTAGGGPQHVIFGETGIERGRYADYWAPAGYGSIRWDFARSWNAAGDFRRTVTVLEGITPYPFMTNSALGTVGGFLSRWFELVLTAGYSNGQTGQAVAGTFVGSYDGVALSTQGRFRLSRLWSAVASYHHYRYYSDPLASLTLGVPSNLQRNAIRVGVAWSLPLIGQYLAQPPDVPIAGRD